MMNWKHFGYMVVAVAVVGAVWAFWLAELVGVPETWRPPSAVVVGAVVANLMWNRYPVQ